MTSATTDRFQEKLNHLSEHIAGITDSDLDELSAALGKAVLEHRPVDHTPATTWEELLTVAPVAVALMRMHDFVAAERNYRQGVLRAAEAALHGGHLVSVHRDSRVFGKWSAECWPRETDHCWSGPDRDTVEEASADARGHSPDGFFEVWSGLDD